MSAGFASAVYTGRVTHHRQQPQTHHQQQQHPQLPLRWQLPGGPPAFACLPMRCSNLVPSRSAIPRTMTPPYFSYCLT